MTINHSLFHFLVVSMLILPHYYSFRSPFRIHLNLQSHLRETAISNDILSEYYNELVALRGTPELVDRLVYLAAAYPGFELDINLYRAIYPFKLDEFQEEGLLNLISGKNVIVSTPTGSGKTLVGELAIYFALMMGLKIAYTTPLKALSNQKFQDFTRRFGGDRVGLLTGDVAINRGAQVTVMTTEVFRNMIYDQSPQNQQPLANLFMVCFDEFHYMNDPERGTVWEESVISCPSSIRILALSATMGNVDDIKGWISAIHGPTELILSDHRPVPLRYLFAVKKNIFPLFRDPNAGPGTINGVKKTNGQLDPGNSINPSILKVEEQAMQGSQMRLARSGRPMKAQTMNTAALVPKYTDLIFEMNSLKMLPAIVFIFSRQGCEENAKYLLQSKAKLLTNEEISFVSQAITNFAAAHPEIPISKANVQLLRGGVGVHHAGLIPVWKGFIEDLFNANKVKVLFATETLAAGVNMPARTTVISSVTKRISSEVVKLKTSQLLQMAGRAGRRGKDTEGTVVLLRSKFEDAKVGHKILISPVDGIQSHFKISYGLAVKLLETRTFEECRALIERGFSSYLMQIRIQKRINRKKSDEQLSIERHREILQKYTLRGARDFIKIARRLEKEKNNLQYLLDRKDDADIDLVETVIEYMPLGVGVSLCTGDSGFFLGQVRWGDDNDSQGYGIICKGPRMLVVDLSHMRTFSAEAETSIPAKKAKDLLDLISKVTLWDEIPVPKSKMPILEGQLSLSTLVENENIASAISFVEITDPVPMPTEPGSVVKQRILVEELEDEYKNHDVAKNNEDAEVIAAIRYVTTLKDPAGFVSAVAGSSDRVEVEKEIYAWTMFQNVVRVMQKAGAMDGFNSTDLGRTVSSFSGDNELWAALALQTDGMATLNSAELAAVMCALVTDGFKAKNSFFKYEPSDRVKEVYSVLEKLSWELKDLQGQFQVDFPVHLCTEMGGLVESWVNGLTWRELCKDTSMDQGDLCRVFRRTVELLRQIPLAYGVSNTLANTAMDAVKRMNRFPVADADSETSDSVLPVSGMVASAGLGFGAVKDGDAVSAEEMESLNKLREKILLGEYDEDNEEGEDGVDEDSEDNNTDMPVLDDEDDDNDERMANFERILDKIPRYYTNADVRGSVASPRRAAVDDTINGSADIKEFLRKLEDSTEYT